MRALKRLGVTSILTITPTEEERFLTERHGLSYKEIAFKMGTPLPPEVKARFLQAVHNAEGRVYVHGDKGNRRAGVLGVLYRTKVQGWPFDKALLETVIQGNVNPVEKVERSSMIVATTIHGRPAIELLLEDQRQRFFATSPQLAPAAERAALSQSEGQPESASP